MWFNHEQITTDGDLDTIANLQRDMKFGTPRKLSCKVSWVDSSPESSRAYSKTSLGGSGGTHLMGLGHGASRGAARCCPWPWPLPEDGKILHRDISKNNIIIIEFPAKEAPKGRLIDLDLAKELDSMPSGARQKNGTMHHHQSSGSSLIMTSLLIPSSSTLPPMTSPLLLPPCLASRISLDPQLMAIEVLEGKGHTSARLRVIFNLFVWMCIRYGYEVTGRQK